MAFLGPQDPTTKAVVVGAASWPPANLGVNTTASASATAPVGSRVNVYSSAGTDRGKNLRGANDGDANSGTAAAAADVVAPHHHAGYWVCGAGSADINGYYHYCDETWFSQNKSSVDEKCDQTGAAVKQVLYFDQVAAEWQLFNFLGPAQKPILQYSALVIGVGAPPPSVGWVKQAGGLLPIPKVGVATNPNSTTCNHTGGGR